MNRTKPIPQISIIIPVYNTERYVRECLESVVNQTLRDIEIIVVNDASPDNSQSIIDEYARQDERIISIVHRENQGLGGARNTGVSRASGEYIMFLDSDDTFMLNACEKLCNKMIKTGADFIAFNYYEIDEQSRVINKQIFRKGGEAHLRGEQILKAYIGGVGVTACIMPVAVAAWNKIYKASIWHVHSIKYPQHMYMEDLYVIVDIVLVCTYVVGITDALINYRKHTTSIMGSPLSKKYIHDLVRSCAHNKRVLAATIKNRKHISTYQQAIISHFVLTYRVKIQGNYQLSLEDKDIFSFYKYWHVCAKRENVLWEFREFLKKLLQESAPQCDQTHNIEVAENDMEWLIAKVFCYSVASGKQHHNRQRLRMADIKLRQRRVIILTLFSYACVVSAGFLLLLLAR